jgi:hypothetical protein
MKTQSWGLSSSGHVRRRAKSDISGLKQVDCWTSSIPDSNAQSRTAQARELETKMQTTQRDPFSWGYWSQDISDGITEFQTGENIARDFLKAGAGEGPRVLLSQVIADMRDHGKFDNVAAGFVSLLARKAQIGAKPADLKPLAEHLAGDGLEQFLQAGREAIADLSSPTDLDRLLPTRPMARIEAGVLHRDRSAAFAGYVTVIIAAALACGEH